MKKTLVFLSFCLLAACETIDRTGMDPALPEAPATISLEEVARLFAELPLGPEHVQEVHDATEASSGNGYDEEYTLRDLFADPGSGVGDAATKAAGYPLPTKSYANPLRDVIAEHVRAKVTKAEGGLTPEEYLEALSSSDFQVYWPYMDDWDGKTWPVITFDPADGSSRNFGYELLEGPDGSRRVETVLVDEEMARSRPVWVINRNDDSAFTSLELRRRLDPDWGSGGGEILVRPRTKAPEGAVLRTLVLKDFLAHRNYDPWFCGASEFFCKIGAVEDFFASTEAEMRLYTPTVTDFMVVVRRKEVGQRKPFNAVLVSRWSEQLDAAAFLLTEDDGGSQTDWKCTAEVKLDSKTWGINLVIPFRSRDDIVWRGQLSSRYFEKYNGLTGHFGDVDLTFEILTL